MTAVHLSKEFANSEIIRALWKVGHVESRLPSEVHVYLVIMHALLILRKCRWYTIPCYELDSGNENVWQLSDFNFANSTALIIGSENAGKEAKTHRRL
jgi:hypothetical protein